MFALDSNTLVYYFKGVGNVSQRLLATPPQEIAIPSIVLYEIESGIMLSSSPQKRRHALEALLQVVSILPFDENAARAAAEARASLQKIGALIGPLDLLIAGTALANAAVLVTHNAQEFERIPHLRVVDWYS